MTTPTLHLEATIAAETAALKLLGLEGNYLLNEQARRALRVALLDAICAAAREANREAMFRGMDRWER
jgi:hypothetical protein